MRNMSHKPVEADVKRKFDSFENLKRDEVFRSS